MLARWCRPPPPSVAEQLSVNRRDQYVAFIDLLGFSAHVEKDWESAAATYGTIMTEAVRLHEVHTEWWSKGNNPTANAAGIPTLQTLSDSVLIVGPDLVQVASLAQAVQTAALAKARTLVRGGIAFGPHASVEKDGHAYVVSKALTVAAGLESTVANYPRIVLDRPTGVEASAMRLVRESGHGLFMECEDGLWMTTPFSWTLEGHEGAPDRFVAARGILEPLGDEYKCTKHSVKYDWMLSCVDRAAAWLDELRDHPGNPANCREGK